MTELSRWRWAWYAAGAAMVGYGFFGLLSRPDTREVRWAVLLVASALAHDLVFAPLVLLLGRASRPLLRGRVRPVVQGALLVGVSLLLVALPALGRPGAKADNASVLPRDYVQGLLVSLAVVAGGALLLLVVPRRR